jgi:hypothetical protein
MLPCRGHFRGLLADVDMHRAARHKGVAQLEDFREIAGTDRAQGVRRDSQCEVRMASAQCFQCLQELAVLVQAEAETGLSRGQRTVVETATAVQHRQQQQAQARGRRRLDQGVRGFLGAAAPEAVDIVELGDRGVSPGPQTAV